MGLFPPTYFFMRTGIKVCLNSEWHPPAIISLSSKAKNYLQLYQQQHVSAAVEFLWCIRVNHMTGASLKTFRQPDNSRRKSTTAGFILSLFQV